MKNNVTIGFSILSVGILSVGLVFWALGDRDYPTATSGVVGDSVTSHGSAGGVGLRGNEGLELHEKHGVIGLDIVEMSQTDPKEAIEMMKVGMANDEEVRNNCHGIMHQVGVKSHEVFGFSGAMAFQDGVCGSGYIHGVLMGEFGTGHNFDVNVGDICADTPTESCFHGVGHGLMVALENDVLTSLSSCDDLPEEGRRDCYDGVFMHVYDNEENGVGMLVDIPNFETLCRDVPEKYSLNCFFYMPRYFQRDGFQNMIDKCNAFEGFDGYMCALGAGHTNMKYNIHSHETTLAFCNSFPGERQEACREGSFMYYFFDRTTAELSEEGSTPEALCSLYDGDDYALCLGSYSKYFGVI